MNKKTKKPSVIEKADDKPKVRCTVQICFEAPDEGAGKGACAFLRDIVRSTIESSNWGEGSFAAAVEVPEELVEKSEPETKSTDASAMN